jgi:hypothetical protein
VARFSVTLLSPVVGDGTAASPYRPQLSDDFPAPHYSEIIDQDISQPGDPAVMLITVVVDEAAMFDGNDDYFVLEVDDYEEQTAD